MADTKNIGAVEASLSFDTSEAVKSLNHLDSMFAKHKQRMARFATDSIKHMNALDKSVNESAKSITKSLDRMSSSLSGSFDKSLGSNFTRILDAMNEQTRLLSNAMKNVGDRVKELNGQVSVGKKSIDGANTSTIKWFDSTNSLFNSFSKITFKLFIIEQGVRQIYDLFNGMVGPGFQFASSMETLRIGMAGILASTTKMGDAQTTYAQGLEISEKILKRMQIEALRTTMTVQELSEAYQATLAGGLNAGMGLEQIMDLTVAAANAVKSFGLPKQQVIQELRGLISGEAIRPGVDMLGTVLGYTTATVNKLREEGTLYEDIMKRMEGFKLATYDLDTTWAGMLNNMIDGFNKLAGTAVTGLFDNMKRRVREIREAFYTLQQEERTYTNKRTGKQETRTVTTDIIINQETQKRLTLLYDTIDNFIELLYTLGKISLPVVKMAFDAIVPAFNAFFVRAKEVVTYLSALPKVISSMVEWLLKVPSAVLNGIGSVIDTFWMFTMNIIAAKHALKQMGDSIGESASKYGAFGVTLTVMGAATYKLLTLFGVLKAKVLEYIGTQVVANSVLATYNAIMKANSLKEVVALFASVTKQVYNNTAGLVVNTIATKAHALATNFSAKAILGALKALGLYLAKIVAVTAAMAASLAMYVSMAALLGGLVYVIYKLTDATSVWGQSFQNLWKSASGVLEGLKLKFQAVFASKEESKELTQRAEQAFKDSAEAWKNATTSFTLDNVKKEIIADVDNIKKKLTNAISFKDVVNPEIDESELPNIEALFPAGASAKLKDNIKEVVKKYADASKIATKLAKVENEILKVRASMYGGEAKKIAEKDAKLKGLELTLKEVVAGYEEERKAALQIADVGVRDRIVATIDKQIAKQKELAKVQREQANFQFDFEKLQERSTDIVTMAFGEYGDIEVKLAKNKELLTNFMEEIDALTARGAEGKDFFGKDGFSEEAKNTMQTLLETSPEKLAEQFNIKKELLANFVDEIKTKLAEASAAEAENLKIEQAWMEKRNEFMDNLKLGMGEAVYEWISGAKDIGQAMRDMVQELLRNALKLLVQWATIYGLLVAFGTPPRTASKSASKIVLGIDDAKAEGGLIEGSGSTTGDSRLVALSPGEYVIRASAVRKLGVGYLNSLNEISAKRPSGIIPPISRVRKRFAEGGYVDEGGYQPKTVSPVGGNGVGGNVVFNMTFQSLDPEAGAEMMKEQLPFIKNAVVNWMRSDTSVRTAARGAVR